MTYVLRHHFDPEFDHQNLKPRSLPGGRVNHVDLGYVQNVVAGQVLAEWELVPEGAEGAFEGQRLSEEMRFPAGDNCRVDPEDPGKLLASENGYVFYLNGRITVKTLLNVRKDVDLSTGNVLFVGDVVVHGGVTSGFTVKARNIKVKGTVEAADLIAAGSILLESGVKGHGKAIVQAGERIRLPFCEAAMILGGKSVAVTGSCLHSDLYAGDRIGIKERCIGGRVTCRNRLRVEGQLGGGMAAQTRILLGYDPHMLLKARKLDDQIQELTARRAEYREYADRADDVGAEFRAKLEQVQAKLGSLARLKAKVWEGIQATSDLDGCRVEVPGQVKPGVEISIGQAFLKVNDYLNNVRFTHAEGEIMISSPAVG